MKHSLALLFFSLSCFAGIPFVEPAKADSSATYTERDGYWWQGNVAYTRVKVYLPVEYYYENGVKYAQPQKFYWKYTVAPINKTTFPYSPDWKVRADAILAAVAKAKGNARLLAIENDSYLKSQAQLRLAIGELNVSGGVGNLSLSYLPYQGNTLYGPSAQGNYSVNQATARFSTEINMDAFLQAVARTTDRSMQGGFDSLKNLQELAGAIADANARITAARGPSVSASASATGAGASVRIGGAAPAPAPTGNGNPVSVAPAAQQDRLVRAQAIVNAGCLSCHAGGGKAKGNLDLSTLSSLTVEQWRKVVQRTQREDEKRMPPPDSPQLTPEQKDDIRLAR